MQWTPAGHLGALGAHAARPAATSGQGIEHASAAATFMAEIPRA